MKKNFSDGKVDLDSIIPGLSFTSKSGEQQFLSTLASYFPANFVLPANPDIEEIVIGTIVSSEGSISLTFPILNESDFHHPTCRKVYSICSSMYRSGESIDLITVSERYRRLHGEPVSAFLVGASNRIASPEHLEDHCRLVKDYSMKRAIIQIGLSSVKSGLDQKKSGMEVFSLAQNWIMNAVATGTNNIEVHKPADITLDMVMGLDKAVREGTALTGYRTGIDCIDNHFGGLQPTDLIIIAARPGMGKTSLLISMVFDPTEKNPEPVLLFSLEMSRISLYYKLAAFATGISVNSLVRKQITEDELRLVNDHVYLLEGSNIHIVDASGLTVEMIMILSRLMKHLLDVKLIGVDYVGLSDTEERIPNKVQQIGVITKGLKNTAKALNIPVVALSQLSRAVETRGGDKVPQLSDLRDSGNIEEDADIISFVYRPEYYKFKSFEDEDNTDGLAYFIVAKYRNGSPERFKLHFDKKTTRFTDTWGRFDWAAKKTEFLNRPAPTMIEIGNDLDLEDPPF